MIVTGDVSLQVQSDVDALAGIREITGKLTIVSPAFTTLALPDLEVVGGEIELDDSAVAGLTSIAFPKLVSTGDDINLLSERATTLDLSDLVATGNGVELNAGGLTALALPCLATTPNLTIAGAATTISLPSLVTAPQLTIANDPNLTAVDLPALRPRRRSRSRTTRRWCRSRSRCSRAWVTSPISDVVALTTLDAPALGSAASVNISGTALTALPLPALKTVTNSFIVSSDSSLTTLAGVSAITSVGALGGARRRRADHARLCDPDHDHGHELGDRRQHRAPDLSGDEARDPAERDHRDHGER